MENQSESINLKELELISKDFERSNNDLDEAYLEMKAVRESLRNGWSGKAADKYIQRFDIISDRFEERVKPAKENYASFLKNTNSGYDETEKTNTSIGQSFDDVNTALVKFM